MTAGIETLTLLRSGRVYEELEEKGGALAGGIEEAHRASNLECCLNRVGSMWTLFFRRGPLQDDRDVGGTDVKAYARYFRAMLERGISLPPSQFEAAFLSAAHTSRDVAVTVEMCREALRLVARDS
jgi:glutamate-1-semialdehyde 2,1-aminomutase